MSYIMVVLVLATSFGLDGYEAALAIFGCGVSDQPVSLRERCTLAFDRLGEQSSSQTLHRGAPAARELAPRNGSLPRENLRKLPPSRTLKNR